MKKFVTMTMIAGTLALGFSSFSASAADVRGDVDTNVKAAAIIQKNTGIANKNEAHLGSVAGKSRIGGDFKSRVRVGAVIQSNSGIANKNEGSLGSVTD